MTYWQKLFLYLNIFLKKMKPEVLISWFCISAAIQLTVSLGRIEELKYQGVFIDPILEGNLVTLTIVCYFLGFFLTFISFGSVILSSAIISIKK